MNVAACCLILLGLAVLTIAALPIQILISVSGVALAAGWLAALALRAPRLAGTLLLSASAALCAAGAFAGLPMTNLIFALSAVLYGWDMAFVGQHTARYPREATAGLLPAYALRGLGVAVLGFAIAGAATNVRLRMGFLPVYAAACTCLALLFVLHRRFRRMGLRGHDRHERADG